MSRAHFLFSLPGLFLFSAVALASPAGAQLRSSQVQFGPVLVAPTCELQPTAGALKYSASAPGRISSDGTSGKLSASLSGATGSGNVTGPVIQFSNPMMTVERNSVVPPTHTKEMKIDTGSWMSTPNTYTMPFPSGVSSLLINNVDVQFVASTPFPAGTYRATVDVSCFESAPAGS